MCRTVERCCTRADFGAAVVVEHRNTWKRLLQRVQKRRGERAPCAEDVSERVHTPARRLLMARQNREARWHAAQTGDPVLVHRLKGERRITQALQQHDGPAGNQAAQHLRERVGVPEGKEHEASIDRGQPQISGNCAGIDEQRRLAEHHSLWRPGRAACENDRRNIIETAGIVRVLCGARHAHTRQQRGVGLSGNDELWSGAIFDSLTLVAGKGRIERDDNAAAIVDRKQRHQEFRAVGKSQKRLGSTRKAGPSRSPQPPPPARAAGPACTCRSRR